MKCLAGVGQRGTPLPAVAVTALAGCVLILTGSFNQILALFAVLTALNYCVAFLSLSVPAYLWAARARQRVPGILIPSDS